MILDRRKGAERLGWLWAGRGSQMNLLLREKRRGQLCGLR